MFFRSQATGCVVGVVLFNVVGLLFRKKLAQRAAARTAKNTIPPQA
jgi:hypothetical protein